MIEQIKQWLLGCEYLLPFMESEKPKLEVESSSNETTMYSMETTPAEPIFKRFIDGTCIRQITIEFKCYTEKLKKEIENQLHLESIVEWVELQNKSLPNGFYQVEALTNGYIFEDTTNGSNALYQISINVKYYSEV